MVPRSIRAMETASPKQKCHPDRSVAQWRDLLFIIRSIESEWKRRPPLCHPDRSVPGFPATLHWTDHVCALP